MSTTSALLWALWVFAPLSGGTYLPTAAAYFPKLEDCVRVQRQLNEVRTIHSRCVQAEYAYAPNTARR